MNYFTQKYPYEERQSNLTTRRKKGRMRKKPKKIKKGGGFLETIPPYASRYEGLTSQAAAELQSQAGGGARPEQRRTLQGQGMRVPRLASSGFLLSEQERLDEPLRESLGTGFYEREPFFRAREGVVMSDVEYQQQQRLAQRQRVAQRRQQALEAHRARTRAAGEERAERTARARRQAEEEERRRAEQLGITVEQLRERQAEEQRVAAARAEAKAERAATMRAAAAERAEAAATEAARAAGYSSVAQHQAAENAREARERRANKERHEKILQGIYRDKRRRTPNRIRVDRGYVRPSTLEPDPYGTINYVNQFYRYIDIPRDAKPGQYKTALLNLLQGRGTIKVSYRVPNDFNPDDITTFRRVKVTPLDGNYFNQVKHLTKKLAQKGYKKYKDRDESLKSFEARVQIERTYAVGSTQETRVTHPVTDKSVKVRFKVPESFPSVEDDPDLYDERESLHLRGELAGTAIPDTPRARAFKLKLRVTPVINAYRALKRTRKVGSDTLAGLNTAGEAIGSAYTRAKQRRNARLEAQRDERAERVERDERGEDALAGLQPLRLQPAVDDAPPRETRLQRLGRATRKLGSDTLAGLNTAGEAIGSAYTRAKQRRNARLEAQRDERAERVERDERGEDALAGLQPLRLQPAVDDAPPRETRLQRLGRATRKLGSDTLAGLNTARGAIGDRITAAKQRRNARLEAQRAERAERAERGEDEDAVPRETRLQRLGRATRKLGSDTLEGLNTARGAIGTAYTAAKTRRAQRAEAKRRERLGQDVLVEPELQPLGHQPAVAPPRETRLQRLGRATRKLGSDTLAGPTPAVEAPAPEAPVAPPPAKTFGLRLRLPTSKSSSSKQPLKSTTPKEKSLSARPPMIAEPSFTSAEQSRTGVQMTANASDPQKRLASIKARQTFTLRSPSSSSASQSLSPSPSQSPRPQLGGKKKRKKVTKKRKNKRKRRTNKKNLFFFFK